MKSRHQFKLLSKATVIYLIFTFITFLVSAIVLSGLIDQFIRTDVEHFFVRVEREWKEHNRRGRQFPRNNRTGPPIDVVLITHPDKYNLDKYPVYTDTLMYNPFAGEDVVFRKKTTIVRWGGDVFKLSMTFPIADFLQLKHRVFAALIPAFIILAVIIVLFNFVASGYLFRPFNRILEAMRTYQVGQKKKLEPVNTSTQEFTRMQNLFHNMTRRIESDYQHLKEYTENMAHEMQTPLTIIHNKTENLIANRQVMEKNGTDVKVIWDEVNHLSKLGNTLNLITKIENREFSETEQIRTEPVIEQHLEALKELADFKFLEIQVDLSEQHTLQINPYLLEILLKNLLRNAIRYASSDGPITVNTTSDELVISNYGEPLDYPPEKLFERFHRTSQDVHSMGLGLALAKKICEMNSLEIIYLYEDGQHIFSVIHQDNTTSEA